MTPGEPEIVEVEAEEVDTTRREVWVVRNKLGGLLLASEEKPLRDDAVKMLLRNEEVDKILQEPLATCWLILDENDELLHLSLKRVIDPRAIEVPAENSTLDLPLKKGIVWLVKDRSGVVVDLCDHYPLHPDAQAVAHDDPDVTTRLSADAQAREISRIRSEALKRVLERLTDEELAKP